MPNGSQVWTGTRNEQTGWWVRNLEIYEPEIEIMHRYYPGSRLQCEADGRLAWYRTFQNPVSNGQIWHVRAGYEPNYPSPNAPGGSIKVYPVGPSLDDLAIELGHIPHVERDSAGRSYILLTRVERHQTEHQRRYTGALALSYAMSWICVFELWRPNHTRSTIASRKYLTCRGDGTLRAQRAWELA